MQNLFKEVKIKLQQALLDAFNLDVGIDQIEVQKTSHQKFGHLQTNVSLKLSKQLRLPPPKIGQVLTDYLSKDNTFSKVEIAGPGFINFFIHPEFFNSTLNQLKDDPYLGVNVMPSHPHVVVDYSSPNVAKEMHVGHLRSTIIGDAICRFLTFVGWDVIRQNHIGDWGTQFGMLIEYIIQNELDIKNENITKCYQQAKKMFDEDTEFAKKAKERVVMLQQHDEKTHSIWEKLVAQSEQHFTEVYEQLDVLLGEADVRPESFYNPKLQPLIDYLQKENISSIDQGAKVIFLDGFKDKDNHPLPMLIQKSDGGFLYATTDLAAIQFRIETLKAKRVVYCVDARQQQHFDMLFAAANKIGWCDESIDLNYALFGTILGDDGKPFKTRSGDTVKLLPLISKAIEKATTIVSTKNPSWDQQRVNETARTLAVASLKYSDLCNDKIKNYAFSYEKMLSFDGNTAPYLLNAYVRVQSLLRKANISMDQALDYTLNITEQNEIQLAYHLVLFSYEVETISTSLELHRMCHYLYQLASLFHHFYEHQPILRAETNEQKESRLCLVGISSKILAQGLNLLGIKTLDHM